MNLEKIIAATFEEMAQGLETGSFGRRPKIALTGMGSEHGEVNSIAAAKMAADRGVDVYYIGTLEAYPAVCFQTLWLSSQPQASSTNLKRCFLKCPE